MGLLSNKIRREQLNPGDHIYTYRNVYSYSHHGIYVGDGKVIHLTRAPGPIIFSSYQESSPTHPPADRVVCCSIEEFLSGGDLYLYAYDVKTALFVIKRGGTCTRTSSDPPENVLSRAYIHLEKGFGDYNLFQNNCEDFAIFCKTGLLNEGTSKPGSSGQIQFLFDILLVVIFTPYQFLPSGLALVVYGLLYVGYRLIEGRDIVEKVTRMENDSTRSSLPTQDYVGLTIFIYNYWSWTPASSYLLWIRFFIFFVILYSFVFNNHLISLGRNVKLGEFATWIAMVLIDWYWNSATRKFSWTKLMFLSTFLLLFASDRQRYYKLVDYTSTTGFIHTGWHWTPENPILQWIRIPIFYMHLYRLFSDYLFNHRFKLGRFFFACFVIHSVAFLLGKIFGLQGLCF